MKIYPSKSEYHGVYDHEFTRGLKGHLGGWVVLAMLSLACTIVFSDVGLAITIIALNGLAISLNTLVYRRSQYDRYQHYRQLEALLSMYNITGVKHPVPHTRMWAGSPDFLLTLVDVIRSHRPNVILELGSGASTLFAAYHVQQIDHAHIYSFDHSEEFAGHTRTQLEAHGLVDKYTVSVAPIVEIEINRESWNWYAPASVTIEPKIDLLIVDGPPDSVNPLARYPALPILYDKLSGGALILVDDYKRSSERTMVERWRKEFGVRIERTFNHEKGAALLRKD